MKNTKMEVEIMAVVNGHANGGRSVYLSEDLDLDQYASFFNLE